MGVEKDKAQARMAKGNIVANESEPVGPWCEADLASAWGPGREPWTPFGNKPTPFPARRGLPGGWEFGSFHQG